MAGKKRASPGAVEEKNPFDVEVSPEQERKIKEVSASIARTELILERAAQKKLAAVYEKRRVLSKEIPKFWPVALTNHPSFAIQIQHTEDQTAFLHLVDLWVERDAVEPRAFTLEFHFSENPYFSDSVLKKEYKYIPPPAAEGEVPDEDGITPSMLDFNWERDIEAKATKINWKDDEHNLVKLHPQTVVDDDLTEGGSFFNFFETATDYTDIGILLANEIFPEAIDYFTGEATAGLTGDDDDEDITDSEEEDEDDDAEEIDLEKPRTKKQRKA